MKRFYLLIGVLTIGRFLYAQQIPLPETLPQTRPRLLTNPAEKEPLLQKIQQEKWAKEIFEGIKNRVDVYVERTADEPDWLYSRLMMYWKSKATNVYINGGVYVRADGEAPVPTVRFGSTRGVGSPIKRPKLEDIIPYMDDTKGVYFHNTAKAGNPLEWADQATVSGAQIESVNHEIIRIGRDAAFVYWTTGEKKYAKLAYDVFNTYMMGMYHRNEPRDLGNGHAQTLVAMTTFEVIQEGVLPDLAEYYDFLHGYIQAHHADKIVLFESAFKKWIDVTIKNGVPHNNWNLHGDKFILPVAMVLEDNKSYEDGKGREYYIDYIFNRNSPRQWAIPRLMEYGYDFNSGIWNECPGYAQSVTSIFMDFIVHYDHTFHQNLLPYMPVMRKAVDVLPQYLFPNGQTTAFGDSYYGSVNTSSMHNMIRMAQKYNNSTDEAHYTRMYKLFSGEQKDSSVSLRKYPARVSSFFSSTPISLRKDVSKGSLSDYITQTFYAPTVSWFVQRNKFTDPENGMMISQYGSLGNHAHSNGIAMELYGKGYVLGAESGIGSSYFEKPYLEYYSQFPAHNTVMVDGISKYPEMLSNHPFDLLGHYPASGKKEGYYPDMTYSDVYFLEPESRSDQRRTLGIVRTGESSGYYVDIFRSKKQRQGDKFHDYFYHNLGQELFVKDMHGKELDLQPNNEMAFAGGHLFALDYMWDKRSARTDKDYQTEWKMSRPDSNHLYMNLWMKGYANREVFSIKAPPTKAFRPNHGLPYDVLSSPFLTIAARQHGEAWNRPFVSIFEPYTEEEGRSITSIQSFEVEGSSPDFVGLEVISKHGQVDYIFSSVVEEKVHYKKMTVEATYGIIREKGSDFTLFLGNGTHIEAYGLRIESEQATNAVVEYRNGKYFVNAESPITIRNTKGKKIKLDAPDFGEIKL
ncbi:hypothetical protein FAZ19_02625 [Sphingobacterium alkalisoli]|uniref:Six-hairpin glycosidase n=1 Tax=Sphingobacterium alkalisoli TaxID=1874115 RepID=A0A4U0H8K6_9SPHI|nr:hypothetical protein [Sphingobacterium alkalisoli]TJY68170.1 hypothetical protein FAZ19_02625 [Sphingobacterium alkalisoli]GGH08544.1 hypothetical protein GCM10011418_06050 [Sphingobacterium alkalisoli]